MAKDRSMLIEGGQHKKSPRKGKQKKAPELHSQYRGEASPPVDGKTGNDTRMELTKQAEARSDMREAAAAWFEQAKKLKGDKQNFLGKPEHLIDPKEHVYSDLLYPGKSKNKTYY